MVKFIIAIVLLMIIYFVSTNWIMELSANRFFKEPYLDFAEVIKDENIARIKALSGSLDLNHVGEEGMSLLAWAFVSNAEDSFEELLKLGADPNFKTQGESPVTEIHGLGNLNYLETMLKNGGDPNAISKTGDPLIIYSAVKEDWEGIILLIKYGANINQLDKDGGTALMTCAYVSHYENAQKLIAMGADIHIQDKYGGSFLNILESSNPNRTTPAYEKKQKLLDFLRAKNLIK